MSLPETRTVAILGSTGSIGTQALQIVAANPDRFTVTALTAGGKDPDLLAQQAVSTGAGFVGMAHGQVQDLADRIGVLKRAAGDTSPLPQIEVGPDAAVSAAESGADAVLNGITGSIGLEPTLAALRSGATLALANKESLIVGGPLVKAQAKPDQIVPVDSEHSAIAQCLRSGRRDEVRRLVVTASGGPFRTYPTEDLKKVSPEQALAHPNFAMGQVITTNSATLVNKGLEVIEAHLLFDIPFEAIDVVVHPQQVIHSMVEFIDGATIAQASPPSMLIPIALGLGWPDRVPDAGPAIDWTRAASWDFEPLDDIRFPAVALARQVGIAGSTYPAVYNAANEECVAAFLAGHILFTDIVTTIETVVASHQPPAGEPDLADVLGADDWARAKAREVLAQR